MATPLPIGEHIYVSHRILPSGYCMPSMEMATDHYSIGFIVTGDRRAITPLQTYTYSAGDVAMSPPYYYHRTLAETDIPYEGYLIKFTPDFIQPFQEKIGKQILEELYEEKVCHFLPDDRIIIHRLFQEMLKEYQKSTPYKEFILQGMLFRLFTTIWEKRLLHEKTEISNSPLSEPIFEGICYIETHYFQSLTLEQVAKEVNLSTAYFSRLFQAQLGMSFTEYVSNVRIRHAQILLTQTDKSIMDIALETGFCHGDYFATHFRRKTGMTPREFRQKARRK